MESALVSTSMSSVGSSDEPYAKSLNFNCQHNIEVTNPSDTYRPIGRYWPIAQLRQRPTRFEIEIRGLTRRHRLEMRLQINPCLFARPCGLKVLLNLILQCFIVI